MHIRWVLFEIGINVYQGWLYCFFLRRRLNLKPEISARKVRCADALVILGVAAFYSLYIWADLPITDSVVWLITSIYSLLIFSEKKLVILAWNVCLGALMLCTVNLCSSVTRMISHATWEQLMTPSPLRVAFVLNTNVVALIILYTVSRLKHSQERLSTLALLVYILLNVALVWAIEMQYNLAWMPNVPSRPVLIAIFALLFAAICAVALLELLSRAAEERAKLETQIVAASMNRAYLQETHAIYEELREYQHNLKHQYALLKQMFADGHIEEGRKYLEELEHKGLPAHASTGNFAVDAVLSVKETHMRKLGIAFRFVACPMTILPIDETDFCALLGNLLDNAIEANQRLPQDRPRHILLQFAKTRDMLYITCVNSANIASIHRSGDRYLSSKRVNKPGYGMPSIRRTVEQAGGLFRFRILQEKAVTEITIPFERA